MGWIILSLVGLLISGGMTAVSSVISILNDKTRTKITNLISKINTVINTDSKAADQILSALQSKNAVRLQSALTSNPILGNLTNAVLQDQIIINELSTKQNLIKNEIANLQNEANSVYSSSIHGTIKDSDKIKKVEDKLDKKQKELNDVNNQIVNFKSTASADNKPFIGNSPSSVNPVSQNVEGGIK